MYVGNKKIYKNITFTADFGGLQVVDDAALTHSAVVGVAVVGIDVCLLLQDSIILIVLVLDGICIGVLVCVGIGDG